jgi:hypothetical protein
LSKRKIKQIKNVYYQINFNGLRYPFEMGQAKQRVQHKALPGAATKLALRKLPQEGAFLRLL